ncbi:MAG: hypothetical protein H6732_17815 [Alphaproteobacteria bacterium]|nr:hypothetical protein [Alphaproteobacteria bacterium]
MHACRHLVTTVGALALVAACSTGDGKDTTDSSDTDVGGDSSDTGDTADSGDTSDTEDTSDTGTSPTAYAGGWSGTWMNTTFSSTGDATLSIGIDQDKKEATFGLDLNGNVFNGGDPPLISLTGPYTSTELTVSVTGDSLFGDFSLTFASDGTVNGMASPPLLPGDMTFTGTATPTAIDLTYEMDDGAGGVFASGTMNFTKDN